MGFLCLLLLIFYVISTFLITFACGTCQCNQMLHPGVFSGERMTFSAEANHDRETRSEKRSIQPFINMGAISFEPPYLDFEEQPIGMPYIRDVVVFNPSDEKNLQLQTLSGDNAHFHASFSKSKDLSPLSNTTFEVIFLARNYGTVENTLFIHTSSGAYPYQVRGFGIQNPYRLRPFLGTRIALDHAFTSVINMYNPHGSVLQVTEVYSSGGNLHLELPTGEDDASHKHWQIAPYETKAIIKLSFLGRVTSNHTSFIRIRTNKFIAPNQFLILPVEVEVSAVPGIFASVDQLDFGTLRRMDEPKTISVSLMNTGNKPVSVTDVTVNPPNKAITVEMKNSVIKHSHKYIKAFAVTYSATNVKSAKQHFGKIVIKTTSKNNPVLEIAYQVNVLQGTLAYSVSKTRFFIGLPPYEPVVREIIVTNTFTFPLVIHRVVCSDDVQESLSIVNFSSPIVVQEQKTVTPFSIRFLANKSMSTFSSSIRVYTNASIFTIPVHCYDGNLQFRLGEFMLDFGTLAVTQKQYRLFEVANPNPVEVTVKPATSNVSLARLTLLDVNREFKNQLTDFPGEHLTIKPGRRAKFRLDVTAPEEAGDYTGNISFRTAYELKAIAFSFKAARGRIEVDPVKIVFNNSFPGQIQKTPLFVKSTFLNPVNIISTVIKTQDKIFSFVPIKKSNAQLIPQNRQKIGDVVFNPSHLCQRDCYLGISSKDKAWFSSLSLPTDTARTDISILEALQTRWNLLHERKNSFSSSLVIDTEAVKGVTATIQGGLLWPSLTSDRPVRFPLTHVGNVSRKTLTLDNPADVPVIVQVVPLSVYPDAQSATEVLSDRFDVELLSAKPSYHSCFSLPTARANRQLALKPDSDATSSLEAKLGLRTSPDAISLIIGPRSKAIVPVQFKPENEDKRTSVIFIRNNLTVLDVITVQGQGARGELMINGKRPSADSVLLFELKQRHLGDCTKTNYGSVGKPYRALTVKKTVLATNPGQLATQVASFSVDGYECEGYGFKVLNCRALNLKPTASVKIDIAFTPDFSVSRVSRRLQIKTVLGCVFEFSLVATIPSELIPLCAAAASRPVWEFHVYISSVILMISLLLVVLVMAHFEANKLIAVSLASLNHTSSLLNGTHVNGEIFDLKKISAPTLETSVSNGACFTSLESDGCANFRQVDKTKARRNSSDSCERLASNNNSLNSEIPEGERSRDKVKGSECSNREFGRKQKKGSSGSQPVRRKHSDSELSRSLVNNNAVVNRPETPVDEVLHAVVPETDPTSLRSSRDSLSSEANSVCSDTVAALPAKKDKSRIRKKTAKVFPAIVPAEEAKQKVGEKEKLKGLVKEKERESAKGKEKGKTINVEKWKDKRSKHGVEMKEEMKETKKRDAGTKTLKSQNEKSHKARRISLPLELGNVDKTKEDKAKSPSLPGHTAGKHPGHPLKCASTATSKKSPASDTKSLPAMSRDRKHSNDRGLSCDGKVTPPTITEAVNSALGSALERAHRVSPIGEFTHQEASSRHHSRCSSVSPSPPLSDSSQNLSQSSRSSSYSSVVGSEESASGSSEHSNKRKKHHAKSQKPSHSTFKKGADLPNPFEAKPLPSSGVCNGSSGKPWRGIWDSSPCEAKEARAMDCLPGVSTSSSLFASTPFDKDAKLDNNRCAVGAPVSEVGSSSGDKSPLYTFQDVKAPLLSTPFIDVDSSVPRFWQDEPIPPLESLILNVKQKRNTNWVNFLDESSAGSSNLPSPGMPQSTKTVAEIWDAGQSADENDGWSAAFSPAWESELPSQAFPPFNEPYESAWSTGTYPLEYYGMPSETSLHGVTSGSEAEYSCVGHESEKYSETTHQLNPYSQPWDASRLRAQQRWSPVP